MRSPQDPPGAVPHDPGPRARRAHKVGVALGALAAALASAGLAYWVSGGGDRTLSAPPPSASAPAQPVAYAAPAPDAAQVKRAYDQFQEIYADQGSRGVVGFARSCAQSVRSDPGVLDFCLAFDIFAAALDFDDPADDEWLSGAPTRDLDLTRSVLPPGADAAARLAQVRAFARQVSLEAPDAQVARAAPPPTPSTTAKAEPAPAASASSAKARRTVAACRSRPTAAQRTVCASPALREAEQRLRVAYRRAVAAGVNPRKLARDQANFRADLDDAGADSAELARLYHKRTQALESQGRRRPAAAKRPHEPLVKLAPAAAPPVEAPPVGAAPVGDGAEGETPIFAPPPSDPAEN
jgi:hypothetical protein